MLRMKPYLNTMTGHLKVNRGISCRTFHVYAAGCRLSVKSIEIEPVELAKSRPVLIFLHEGLGCIKIWRNFPETLCSSTGCSGLVYDRRGYGDSEKFEGSLPLDFFQQESFTYLPALLKEFNIKDAILIGHSDGGTIALLSAAFDNNLIRGIVVEAAHIFVEEITIQGVRNTVAAFEKTDLKEKLAQYHKENTITVFYRWADRWLSSEFRNWNIRNELPNITCPVLLFQGEDDEYGTRAQVEGIAAGVSGPSIVKLIPDCGHVPHFQAKDAVLSEMTRFIEGLFDGLK